MIEQRSYRPRGMKAQEVILSKCIPEPNSGCWLWTAGIAPGDLDYGAVWLYGRNLRASRAAWMAFYGPIPDGLWVLHKCDTPTCVNPRHLWLGTHDDNMADCVRKGRSYKGREECVNGHAMSAENVRVRRTGRRVCRLCCHNDYVARARRIHLEPEAGQAGGE